MPITPVSPTNAVSAVAQGADAVTSSLVLQPGSVISAKVLGVLAENLVRISIANMSLDVMSQVPLNPGQNLQLAVSENDGGIRLSIVDSGAGSSSGAGTGAPSDTVALSPKMLAAAAAMEKGMAVMPGSNAALARNVLTPIEQIAVVVASETAAVQQGSQAPLFANLAAAAANLPPALKQAVLQVLAQQTPLDPKLSGVEIQAAFQKSGLFLEASLASGALPNTGVPDLKAALIVLRQALTTSLAASPVTSTAGAVATVPQPAAQEAPATASGVVVSSTPNAAPSSGKITVEVAPPLVPQIEVGPGQAQAQGRPESPSQPQPSPATAAAAETAARQNLVLTEKLMNNLPRAMAAGTAMSLMQQAGQEIARVAVDARPDSVMPPNTSSTDGAANGIAPPPFRGALPSAQPVAAASIGPNAELPTVARHLLENTDAAIARQTLLQVASLPDRIDTAGQRIDTPTPQWNFEVPFATPQGTAMAQFTISRDGGGNEAEPGKRVGRARFSLDVEPAGPVHALISFSDEKTSVRMWAERPATAAQLRAGVGE
ncbi:MAG: flagellar hook-length control protein FliK, partial [Bradyrhizobium sp.]|uniref:flagellar hook-length control protein FliK n=1 Tax=Bradyrhizobium sp. TaxID=376 RepID=UPI0025C25762